MRTSWRPEGWEASLNDMYKDKCKDCPSKNEKVSEEEGDLTVCDAYCHHEELKMYFEAGADAMLKALKKQGVHFDREEIINHVQLNMQAVQKLRTGTWVFIPDDEAKKVENV